MRVEWSMLKGQWVLLSTIADLRRILLLMVWPFSHWCLYHLQSFITFGSIVRYIRYRSRSKPFVTLKELHHSIRSCLVITYIPGFLPNCFVFGIQKSICMFSILSITLSFITLWLEVFWRDTNLSSEGSSSYFEMAKSGFKNPSQVKKRPTCQAP